MKTILAMLALGATFVPVAARADDPVTMPAIISFDEIDHVYADGDVPAPGSFDRSLREIAHVSARPKKHSFLEGAMHGLSIAGAQIDNATSIVGASGQIGQTLHIAAGAASLAPVANAMGLAGQGRLDTLVQTYVLPRVSPSGAQMLSGYLAAQKETAARYPHAAQAPANTAMPAASPEAAVQTGDRYGRGSLRSYTIASSGRVRIDDPDENVTIVFAPDIGKTYAIDNANRTVHVTPYDASTGPARTPASTPVQGTAMASAAVRSRADELPAITLGQTAAQGFRTRVVMNVHASSTCTKAFVTSDRTEYFAPLRVASTAANSSPFAPADARDACMPSGGVVASGVAVPADRLLLYQANTVERRTGSADERYTLVIERGNLHTATSVPSKTFEIPDGYRQI